MGQFSPTAYDTNFEFVRERSPKTRIIPPKSKPEDNAKIEKTDKPSPGTYNSDVSFKNT